MYVDKIISSLEIIVLQELDGNNEAAQSRSKSKPHDPFEGCHGLRFASTPLLCFIGLLGSGIEMSWSQLRSF